MNFVKDLGEDGIISLFASVQAESPVIHGIGDDCAVLEWHDDLNLLLTSDMLIEGVHFTLDTISPQQLGRKSLAVNLSDIAAMGGTPVAALLSISVPGDVPVEWVEKFKTGIMACAEEHSCQIIGGDTCGSETNISIAIAAIGSVKSSHILLRSGAESGDDIWISGTPGESALGYRLLNYENGHKRKQYRSITNKHLEVHPEISLGQQLSGGKLAHSCIDTSDGLLKDLSRICEASKLGAVLFEKYIPLPAQIESSQYSPLEFALNGGEDYNLLFTASVKARKELETFDNITRIGKMIREDNSVFLEKSGGEREVLTPEPFDHFNS